jgi:hypothetical protein
MGVKTTIAATPPTATHQLSALKSGLNANALTTQLAEAVSEVIYLLKEIIKTFPTGNLTAAGPISTSSASITMAQTIPSWVVAGMSVFDVTKNASLGTVSSGAGTSTLVLSANSLSAGSGSTDVLTISDPNLATYQGLVTSLS